MGSQRAAAGNLGTRGVRVGERPDPDGEARTGDRNQGARVQHLRTVIGQLCGLSLVELRNDARIRHDAGVGRQQTGHVLQ